VNWGTLSIEKSEVGTKIIIRVLKLKIMDNINVLIIEDTPAEK
jgi:hypothetical protein